MNQPGRRLERLVAAIHHAESSGATVIWNDSINSRQFDVTVRFQFGLHSYLTVIECKDYTASVGVEKIDALVTKARDVNANKVILVSSSGFQSGCHQVAERHGVQLLVMSEIHDTSIDALVERVTPALSVFDVRFVRSDCNEEIEFDDWGGRLAYLMKHSKLTLNGGEKSPHEILHEWQMSNPTLYSNDKNRFEISLPKGAELREPYGVSTPISSMTFTYTFTEAVILKSPLLDPRSFYGSGTRVELRDTSGQLHHSARLSSIPLGFDSPVRQGFFYEQASLFNRYYCERIEGDIVTWVLLESYQHGHLVQATFRQKLLYSSVFVEVTDKRALVRLQQMLARRKAK